MKNQLYQLIIIAFIVLSPLSICCQEADTTDLKLDPNNRSFRKGWISMHESWDFHAGIFTSDFEHLNAKFQEQYGKTLTNDVSSIGISWKGIVWVNRFFIHDIHFTYQYIIPETHTFSDSLEFKLQGFHLGIDFCKDLFPRSMLFDCLIGLGFNTGRQKLLRKDLAIEDTYLKYTNPFFSAKIIIEPKLVIGATSFSIRGEYLFDISNPNWNIKTSSLPFIGTSKSSGLFIQGSIGWVLKDRGEQ